MNEFIPIFPLQVVVYPGDALNLHIFELRYKQLISDCSKDKRPFGIPTILDRKIGRLGTLVRLNEISNVQADGQMDIRITGLKVFHVQRLLKLYPEKLYGGADVIYPEDQPEGDAKLMHILLAEIKKLHGLLNVKMKYLKSDEKLTSYDLAHHAGLSLKQEHELLGLLDEQQRQAYLLRHLKAVFPVASEMESLKEKIKLNGHFRNIPGLEI
jgi:Lon protease-like protein